MTNAIQRWVPPDREPSAFATVAAVLRMIAASGSGPSRRSLAGQIACNTIPKARPHAQMFMAWGVFYTYPDVRRMTLEAM